MAVFSSMPTNHVSSGRRDVIHHWAPGMRAARSQCTPNETCGTSPSPKSHDVPRLPPASRTRLATIAPALHPAYTAPRSSARWIAASSGASRSTPASRDGFPPEK